jgi:zinc/manganese transport system substrate-binding protein
MLYSVFGYIVSKTGARRKAHGAQVDRERVGVMQDHRRALWALAFMGALLASAALAACGTAAFANDGRLRVVAAENFWGSVAAQVGGDHVEVTTVINAPNADPHDYEARPEDARAFADAQYVIVNGAGYDAWAQQLIDANPTEARRELDIARLVGKKEGDNEHIWYSPAYVLKVVDQLTADYKALDAANATYYDQRNAAFKNESLKEYGDLITAIKSKYAGAPVGITEPVFGYMAEALGLTVLTPETFIKAIDEGMEPSAADTATYDEQIATRRIKVFIYNAQNATPDVDTLKGKAQTAGIPIVTVTETLTPGGATFQAWQATQLKALQQALATAKGKALAGAWHERMSAQEHRQ